MLCQILPPAGRRDECAEKPFQPWILITEAGMRRRCKGKQSKDKCGLDAPHEAGSSQIDSQELGAYFLDAELPEFFPIILTL